MADFVRLDFCSLLLEPFNSIYDAAFEEEYRVNWTASHKKDNPDALYISAFRKNIHLVSFVFDRTTGLTKNFKVGRNNMKSLGFKEIKNQQEELSAALAETFAVIDTE